MTDQFTRIVGVFQPKYLDTLRSENRAFIGHKMTFEALWPIEEEDGGIYVGQWAWQALDENGHRISGFFGWVPTEDIDQATQTNRYGRV